MESDIVIQFAAGLAALAVLYALAARVRGKRRCRWRRVRGGDRGALKKFTCATCGADAFRSEGRPDRCLAKLNAPGL